MTYIFSFPLITLTSRKHQALIRAIKMGLKFNERRFQEFRNSCLSFRQGNISAEEFYENFQVLFKEAAPSLLPTLIELLPDAQKRLELMMASQDKRTTVTK